MMKENSTQIKGTLWKVVVVDGNIDYIEETKEDIDIQAFLNKKRQKTVHIGMTTKTNMLINAESKEQAIKIAYDRWAGVLNRSKLYFHI